MVKRQTNSAYKWLFLSHTGNFFGGAERSLFEIVKDLRARGHACTVIVPTEGTLTDSFREIGAKTEVIIFDWWLRGTGDSEDFEMSKRANSEALQKISKLIEAFRPTACITNTLAAPWLAYASSLSVTPHIWLIRESLDQQTQYQFRIPFDDICKTVDALSAKIFANSTIYKAALAELLPNHSRTIGVVTPYVPEPALPSGPNEIVAPNGHVLLVSVGQIKPSKRQFDAVKAVKYLNGMGVSATLMLIGQIESQPYKKEIDDYITKHSLGSQIDFVGYKENPYTYTAAADVNIITSDTESFGRVTVEAMYSNKPLVAAAAGGTLEIIEHKTTGLLYEPGDAEALATLIKQLVGNPSKAQKLAEAAYASAKQKYSRMAAHKELMDYMTSSEISSIRPLNLSPLADVLLVDEHLAQRSESLDAQLQTTREKLASREQELQSIYESKRWRLASKFSSVVVSGRRLVSIRYLVLKSYKRALLGTRLVRFKTLLSSKDSAEEGIPVVICLWHRLDRIPEIVEMFSLQNTSHSIDLYFWNNNYKERSAVKKSITDMNITGNLRRVRLFNSRFNVGGFGRYYAARKIMPGRKQRIVIFLDDDQNITADFVSQCLDRFKKRQLASFWSFKNNAGYADRVAVGHYGDSATYCGTGGMVLDGSIFEDDQLFECPNKYWYIEDLWLSFFARRKGWLLTKLDVDISFVDRENDQGLSLVPLKDEFYRYLSNTRNLS